MIVEYTYIFRCAQNFYEYCQICTNRYLYFTSGLLMRPEHSETKTKTETRECETETEVETKKLL